MTARIDQLLLAIDAWLTTHHHPWMWVRPGDLEPFEPEAGARALFGMLFPGVERDEIPAVWKDHAEAVIDAALPHLVSRPERVVKAEALREAAEEAYALERAEDPTRAAFYWLHARARRIERGGL